MELEVIRMCAAAAADAIVGIEDRLLELVMDQPGDLPPALNGIYNYVDHPWVARKALNREEVTSGAIAFPALAIYLEAPPTIDPEVHQTGGANRYGYRDALCAVAFSYLSTEPDDAKRMRDALYFNRAFGRFLTHFNANDQADLLRSRNDISLMIATAFRQETPMNSWQGAICAAHSVVTWRVREHSP